MNEKFESPWLFVIDVEDYVGNFERDLCAYITGFRLVQNKVVRKQISHSV